jgi:hypothetical protein
MQQFESLVAICAPLLKFDMQRAGQFGAQHMFRPARHHPHRPAGMARARRFSGVPGVSRKPARKRNLSGRAWSRATVPAAPGAHSIRHTSLTTGITPSLLGMGSPWGQRVGCPARSSIRSSSVSFSAPSRACE